jgi:hypothetical protein
MYDITEQGMEYSENIEEECDYYIKDNYNKQYLYNTNDVEAVKPKKQCAST